MSGIWALKPYYLGQGKVRGICTLSRSQGTVLSRFPQRGCGGVDDDDASLGRTRNDMITRIISYIPGFRV